MMARRYRLLGSSETAQELGLNHAGQYVSCFITNEENGSPARGYRDAHRPNFKTRPGYRVRLRRLPS